MSKIKVGKNYKNKGKDCEIKISKNRLNENSTYAAFGENDKI